MINLKKLISLILISFLLISNVQLQLTYAASSTDTTPPKLDMSSLKIDKKNVKSGDSITVSLKASDDKSGINKIRIFYKSPKTSKQKEILLKLNSTSNSYNGSLKIDNEMENGTWAIYSIDLYDNANNYVYMYSSTYNFTSMNFNVSNNTNADVTPPKLDMSSLKIDKRDVKNGDSVTISLKASDDKSGINQIRVFYKSPSSSQQKDILLSLNSATNTYYGYLQIDGQMENGAWHVTSIDLYDNANNYIYMYSDIYDFAPINFYVANNTNVDVTPPKLDMNSLNIDKRNVTNGDSVTVSLKASDDNSGINKIRVNYFYPSTSDLRDILLHYNKSTNTYSGTLKIDDKMEHGTWSIYSIDLYDNHNNYIYMYSKTYDFSSIKFNVLSANPNDIAPITDSTVVHNNVTWSNKTINGDLYIAKNASLTINGNVTVNGNIYVLGALKSYGGLTCNGTLYGTSTVLGLNTQLHNGIVIMSGSNSIKSKTMTTYPLTNIPLRIANKSITNNGGKINLNGATLDVADMYIEDTKVYIDSYGTFDVKNLYVGNKTSITIKFKTIFGNTITKTLNLNTAHEDLNLDGKVTIADLSMIANSYNKTPESSNWNSKLDLNNDRIIDIYDIVRVSSKI